MPASDSTLVAPKLLIVDDDAPTRILYSAALAGAGYHMVSARDGIEGLEVAQRENPALVLLDVDMPRANGWLVLDQLKRSERRRPVIMLTGLTDVANRVKGLSGGADDYVCKPCDHRELLARVNAVLRRQEATSPPATMLRFGATTVDLVNRVATREGLAVALTRTEFKLLTLLARRAGQLVTREEILEAVWGYGPHSCTRTVETHVWRLRRKLNDQPGEPRWIQTVAAGGGYRMTCDEAPAAA